MRFFRTLIAAVAAGMLSFAGLAAEHAAVDAVAHEAASHGAEHAGHAVEGLPTAAPVLFHVGPLPVTNSMVLTWVVALLLVAAVKIGVGQVQLIPKGAQNFWEWLVEGLYNFVEGIIGTELVKKTFWFFSSVFILIVATNWFGLLPGVGTIGRGIPVEPGSHKLSHVTEPLLRGANADFNMTFAIALVFFACWLIWALQFNGLVGFLKHIFGPKGGTTGFMFVMMAVVFFAVGLLEIVSILFRPVSLSFRLYGNIFAGENMLEAMTHLGGGAFGWLTALPFYFMELMVGVVQALVFMLLTAVFTLLICSHSEEHGAEGHGHGHGADGHH